ncbi:MAG: hypothetical protein P8R40_10320 [SAR324 cluster bacterium]|nr:hypothetical protein [SAR324 cluster bacterium]
MSVQLDFESDIVLALDLVFEDLEQYLKRQELKIVVSADLGY